MQAASTRRTGRSLLLSASAVRTWHANTSAFIAPMILFFSLSGVMQIVGWQDARGAAEPNALISSIARLHKQQVFAPEPERPEPPAGSRRVGPPPPDEGRPAPATLLLKGLFVLEALALAATTLFGVWIGVTHAKRKRTCWLLLGAGTLIPIILMLM